MKSALDLDSDGGSSVQKVNMKKKKIIITFILFVIVAAAFYLIFQKLYYKETFSIPNGCKAMVTFTSGRYKKEKSTLVFYDRDGNIISKSNFKYNSRKNCIEYNPKTDLYNFFTHQKIYFSDGTSIENKQMQNKYSFATSEGDEDIYQAGYFKPWGMFYKVIPHGLAYKISELGAFDILTVYDDDRVKNIRIMETGNIAPDQKGEKIYFFDDGDGEKFEIKYETIERKKGKYVKAKGMLDTSQCTFLDSGSGVTNGVWDGDDLYLLIDKSIIRPKHHTYMYILHYERKGNILNYIDASKCDYKDFGIAEQDGFNGREFYKNKRDSINYYIDVIMDYPGILKYDKLNKKFSFEKYGTYKKKKDEYGNSVIQLINGKVYIFIVDESGKYKILREDTDGKITKVMEIKALDENEINMLLSSFYYFED